MSMPHCRFCQSPLTTSLVDLGYQPLSNNYLAVEAWGRPEPMYPLHARVCESCWLVQVDDAGPPSEIFTADYAYYSSYSTSWVEHARHYTEKMSSRFGLTAQSLVAEIASNDGYLLQHFVQAGIPVLGVEPATGCAAAARDKGVRTETMFFGRKSAEQLVEKYGYADLIAANNVLAHVPDLNDFASGFAGLLNPRGVATFEFPHLLRLMAGNQFDTIYHEHYSYLSLLAVENIFAANGLRVFDAEELPTHGGSLRVYAEHSGGKRAEQPGVAQVRTAEHVAGLDNVAAYAAFASRVEDVRRRARAFLDEANREGKTVVAYGAAAKGNTLLNFCGIGPSRIAYVVDRNPHKQKKAMPGSHIPILDPAEIARTKPDYVLILPWNLKDEITAQMKDIRGWGARFVVFIPEPAIL
jgi:SAM-dependent methyltransferase